MGANPCQMDPYVFKRRMVAICACICYYLSGVSQVRLCIGPYIIDIMPQVGFLRLDYMPFCLLFICSVHSYFARLSPCPVDHALIV